MSRILLALPFVLLALAAGCGGDDETSGTPPDEYASEVCGALTDWQEQLQQSAQGMAGSNTTDLEQIKSRLVTFMDEAASSTDELIEKVDAAGPPAVENGEAVHGDLKEGLTAAKTSFEQAKTSAQNLDASDPASFQTAAQELGTTLNDQGAEIQKTFETLQTRSDSQELNEAFDEEEACKGF